MWRRKIKGARWRSTRIIGVIKTVETLAAISVITELATGEPTSGS